MRIFQEKIKAKSKAEVENTKYITTDDLDKLKTEIVYRCGCLSCNAGIKEIQSIIYETFKEMIEG